jgi:hypothetical protein
LSIGGDQQKMTSNSIKCRPWLSRLLVLSVSLGLAGCNEEHYSAGEPEPIAVFETDWPNASLGKGKTQGPIQVRYRLEEYADREFKLVAFARSSLKGLGPWQMALTGAKVPKLNDATSQLQKVAQEGENTTVSRTFAFKDPSGVFESVSVRAQVAVGDQLASRTLKIRLGPGVEMPVELCGVNNVCDRALEADTRVE